MRTKRWWPVGELGSLVVVVVLESLGMDVGVDMIAAGQPGESVWIDCGWRVDGG